MDGAIYLVCPRSPSGETGRESESRCGAFRLLNCGGFYQHSEVPVDRLLLVVIGLGNAVQKHCRNSDVLASPSKLWGIIPLVHDVMLDLAGATPSAARRVSRMGSNVLHRVPRHKRWLVLLPLS